MKLKELKRMVVRAQQALLLAERKATGLQRVAKATKAKLELAKIEHKRARKFAKQARNMASEATEQASEQVRIFEKVKKKLSKALAKMRQKKRAGKQKPAKRSVRPARHRRTETTRAKAAANKRRLVRASEPSRSAPDPVSVPTSSLSLFAGTA